MKTKYFAIFIATALSIAFLSCSKSNTYSSGSGSNTGNNNNNNNNPNSISIHGLAFPATSTVKVGSTVTWTNNDMVTHTVTSDDGVSFNSGSLGPGKTFSYAADSVGSFPYHCNIHSFMKATLVVTK